MKLSKAVNELAKDAQRAKELFAPEFRPFEQARFVVSRISP